MNMFGCGTAAAAAPTAAAAAAAAAAAFDAASTQNEWMCIGWVRYSVSRIAVALALLLQ